jgi:hypothetical protein
VLDRAFLAPGNGSSWTDPWTEINMAVGVPATSRSPVRTIAEARPTHYETAPAPSGHVHQGPDALVAALMRPAATRRYARELQPQLQPR